MLYGLMVCLAAGVAAMLLGNVQHIVGAPMIGLFIGIILSNTCGEKLLKRFRPGASFSQKYLLKAGIILAGGTLNFHAIVGVGLSAVPLILFNICLSFLTAWIVGRPMGVSGNTRILVGGGTAICGGTAIATLAPIVKAKEQEMAYAMTAIFLFDILAALLWPYVARSIHLTAWQYGIVGGLAISDTSSVTAAGATFDSIMGSAAYATVGGERLSGGDMAVIVKLTRTVMLVFVAIAVMLMQMIQSRKSSGESDRFVKRAAKAFPLFVLGFLALAVLNTLIGFSGLSIGAVSLSKILSTGYKYLIAVALTGVGFKIRLKELFTDGARPVLLGGCTWLVLAASTLTYVLIFL